MSQKRLILEQMSNKLLKLKEFGAVQPPVSGWIKAVRKALGFTAQQVASRLNITKQAINDLEKREREGSVTIRAMQQAAEAMDMKFVYALLPKEQSLEAIVEMQARKIAMDIVRKTAQTMKLEDQETTKKRQAKAVEELTRKIMEEMPRTLWDSK